MRGKHLHNSSIFGFLAVFGPRSPESRVPRAILPSLVVGELRGMISNRFYDELRKILVHRTFCFTTILQTTTSGCSNSLFPGSGHVKNDGIRGRNTQEMLGTDQKATEQRSGTSMTGDQGPQTEITLLSYPYVSFHVLQESFFLSRTLSTF